MGGRFIETFVEQEGGIAADDEVQAIEKQTADIGGGGQLTDALDVALPALQRRDVVQTAVERAVIGGFNPGIQTRVPILHSCDMLQNQPGQKLFADTSEKPFRFPTPL